MPEKEVNNLFYVCSLIEHVGRKTKNRRSDVVAAMDAVCSQSHKAGRVP
jgi:hypothetical protein